MSSASLSPSAEGVLRTPQAKDNYLSHIRRVILIGLEGVGKTTLINDLTGTTFETSAGKDGCQLVNEQSGSFTLEQCQIDLIDMIGMNCKDPGQWQKQLQGRSDVHGVIFYINGSNGRQSALGDLPRFADYCRNLGIPMLFLYRTGDLDYFAKHGASFEVESQFVKGMNQVRYENLNVVKEKIVHEFKSHTKLHMLIDPIECCKQINELKGESQRIHEELKKLYQERDRLQQELLKSQKKKDELHRILVASSSDVYKLQEELKKLQTLLINHSVAYEKRLQEQKDIHGNDMKYKEELYNNLLTAQRGLSRELTIRNHELTAKIQPMLDRNSTWFSFVIGGIILLILLSAYILFNLKTGYS